MTVALRARALIDGAATRGDIKRLAAELDCDPELRRAVIEEGRRRGADLPDDADQWPARRLLRRARARDAEAQRIRSPIARDEDFVCAHCGAEVPAHGRTARNHCPRCLRSLHVDVVPGDRAADCGGLMDPIGAELRDGELRIRHRCRRCGAERQVRAVRDGAVPDDWEALVATSAGKPPP